MSQAPRLLRALAGAALVFALQGCAQTKVPQEHYYRLEPAPPAAAGRPLEGALLVQRFSADALLSQRPLVYGGEEQPHALKQYNYHFWADPPPRMFQELTVSVLREAAAAGQVVTPELRVDARWELGGRIKRLEQLRGEPSSVVVTLELSLNDLRTGELVWLEEFDIRRQSESNTPAGAVQAMSAALDEIYAALIAGLSGRAGS